MRPMLVSAVLALGACRPGTYNYYDETDLIFTIQEPGRDYSGLVTYGLWPDVRDLSDIADDPIDINHSVVDPVLLEAVQTNMDDAGWTAVDPVTGDPDVIAVIGVVASNNWYMYSYYYWYDWYYWYYPGYYPGYGGYVVNYPSGSVVVLLVKPDEQAPPNADGDVLVPVIWTAAIWGELSDSSSNNLDRMTDGIDQAFLQSPYLDR